MAVLDCLSALFSVIIIIIIIIIITIRRATRTEYNIIVDVLGGWSTDVEAAVKELVGRRHGDVLKKMQRECQSVTLNIARTFKVVTH